MRKKMFAVLIAAVAALSLCACSQSGAKGASGAPGASGEEKSKLVVSALLMPHFETGEMAGDAIGEAQLFYEAYFKDAVEYTLANGKILYYCPETKLAMCVTGSGKTNCAAILASALMDDRFDMTDAYIFAFGCAGGASGYTTLGDVSIATAVCDNELGHTADIRDLAIEGNTKLWYHDSSYDDAAFRRMDAELVDKVYALVKDVKLETTEVAKETMARNFDGAEWATRDPKVILGVHVSGDDFWKGDFDHERALDIASFYFPEEHYAMTEMEDVAIAVVADQFGLLDKCIFMRACVNPDVFINGNTPESTWGGEFNFNTSVEEENLETLDIFDPAMRNNLAVGSKIIDAILDGSL